jgi:hypothetical protein
MTDLSGLNKSRGRVTDLNPSLRKKVYMILRDEEECDG